MKKLSRNNEDGLVHLMPVLIVALLLLAGTVTVASLNQSNNQASNTKSFITKVTINDNNSNVLGESESGSGSSGSGSSGSGSSGSGDSGSGSSGSSGSGSSGSGSSDSGSSGSGSSGSGSSGSDSSGSGSSPRPTSTSGSRISTPRPTSSPRLSPSPSPFRIDQDTRDESGRTRVQVDEGQTRLEQEIFEGGVRKRIEMRNENGRIRVRVKVKNLATGAETEQRFEQRPDEGRVTLRVTENGVEKEVKIRAQNDRFVIEQAGFGGEASASATTNFPLTVDAETNTIIVTTPLGVVNVQQLPTTAIQNILAANVLDKVESTELTEPEKEQDKKDPNKQVVFRIKGVKETRFLGLIKVDAPILTEVSAITGQTTLVKQPWFLNAFGFLFAK